jgi:predicted CopG family antitoxin
LGSFSGKDDVRKRIGFDYFGRRLAESFNDAYEALAREKFENESFTDLILRMTSTEGKAALLLKYLHSVPKDDELARSVESIVRRTRKARLRRYSTLSDLR